VKGLFDDDEPPDKNGGKRGGGPRYCKVCGRTLFPQEIAVCTECFTSPPHSGTETSKAAADSMQESATGLRKRVLDHIAETKGGATCEEICNALDLSGSTVRPRLWELRGNPESSRRPVLVHDSGKRRPTSSGRAAVVWRT